MPRAVLALLLLPAFAAAQEPIRFARTPDISPDGKLIAFSYLGDIWTVEAIGGVARPITLHEAHDINPVFSPDGRWLAFSSNRHGSYDVFVTPITGGKPRRLTFDSASDQVCGWSPDGQKVLFASGRGGFPPAIELYSVPVGGGPETRLGLPDSKEGVWASKANLLAFTRGPGLWYRKGYRGSSSDDVWLADANGANPRRVTDFDGQDAAPMLAPDGRKLYYVSEKFGGPANVIAQDLGSDGQPTGKPTQVTMHTDEAVRKARLSGDGNWVVYECGADLWLLHTATGSTRKLAIEAHADDKSNAEKVVTFRDKITGFALTSDEKAAAIVIHGNLFLLPMPAGGKAARLTDGAYADHSPAFAPDGKRLAFISNRSGREEVYALESDDADNKELAKANKFKFAQLTRSKETESGLSYSPDGARLAFLRAGQLWTMRPDGTDAKVAVAAQQVSDYDWSPDGKWFVYARTDGNFASELYIVPTDGTKAAVNVTRYATFNGDVSWAEKGNKLAFISQRRGPPLMYVLPLAKPAPAPASTTTSIFSTGSSVVDIDFDDIHLRATPAGQLPASTGVIAPDGSRVAFRSGSELWIGAVGGGELSRVGGNLPSPQEHGFGPNLRWSKRMGTLVYYLDNTGSLRLGRPGGALSLALSGSASAGEPQKVPVMARVTVRRQEEYAAMFEQGWRALAERFYDTKFHGADWEAVRAKYRPLVDHVAQKEDLFTLMSLMLGELNASHLGVSGQASVTLAPEETTPDLGLLFDDKHTGPGLKIAEALKHGPADKKGVTLRPGEVILAIDGIEVAPQTNVAKLLNGKIGETLALTVASTASADPRDPKAKRKVELQPVTREAAAKLHYDRWVDGNARKVNELSAGKLGYIHIPGMDEAGLEVFTRALYSDHFDREGLVIDVRNNGGGFTHDQVLNYLGAKEHTTFHQRDGGVGLVLRSGDRKWTKPLVVLHNNRSYSDAEIFPNAVRTLGLGKLVGQATGGLVIGTSGIRLIDGSTFRIPSIGVYTATGVNMEKEGVKPDIAVDVTPEQLAKGDDAQLAKAVEVVQKDVTAWQQARRPATATAGAPPMPPAVAK